MPLELRSAADMDELADRIAAAINEVLISAQRRRGRASLALTGGTMGIRTIAALAASARYTETSPDWERVDLWWSDERFLPHGDPERNVRQAFDAVTATHQQLRFPPENVHIMGSADDFATPEEAAQDYLAELRAAAADQNADGELPPIDIALLGMGPDGHVASVFPGRPETGLRESTVVAVHDSPKPPPLRVSMTLPLICTADHVWFVVAGADKAEAADRLIRATPVEDTPACGAHGTVSTVLFATPDALGRHA